MSMGIIISFAVILLGLAMVLLLHHVVVMDELQYQKKQNDEIMSELLSIRNIIKVRIPPDGEV